MYKDVVNAIRAVAVEVNPNGTFRHARGEDTSLEFDGPSPQIFLLPLRSEDDKSVNSFETWNVDMLFIEQDNQDSTPEEREDIMERMDILCEAFKEGIYEASNRLSQSSLLTLLNQFRNIQQATHSKV